MKYNPKGEIWKVKKWDGLKSELVSSRMNE